MGGTKGSPPEWTVQDEMKLFQALRHNKPVGVNKHFAVVKIVDELKTSMGRHITCDDVWSYVTTMYDITALDEFETVPFPNEITDFTLPESEFPEAISDVGSESDVRNSVADSLDMDQSLSESRTSKPKMLNLEKSFSEDSTPKRPSKRTRASSNATTPNDTPSGTKRRRV